jgi:hypothetical protein
MVPAGAVGLEQGEGGDEGEGDQVGDHHRGLRGEQPVGQPAQHPGGEDRQVAIGDVVGTAAAPGSQ